MSRETVTFVLKKTVVLIGMMGSGKTAIGGALAKALQVPFLDSDAEIVAAANMSIAEIFERDGEPFFRSKETQVIARLLRTQRGILSTGGGAFMHAANREVVSQHGVSVWLKAETDLLWARVRHKTTRPLLHTDNPYATLAEIAATRNPIYAMADLTVEAQPAFAIEDMTQAVIRTLLTRPDVLEARQ